MNNEATRAAGPVVERFASSAGRWLGLVTLAACAVVAVVIVSDDPTGNVRGLYGIGAIALVVWIVLVRPSAALHEHGVLLRNMLRDSFVPSSKIVRCAVLQTLQVATDDKHFYGVAVSKSARGMMREKTGRRYGGLLLSGSMEPPKSEPHTFAAAVDGGSYTDYVASRILSDAQDAPDDDREPVVVTAWPSVIAVLAAAVLIVLTFV